MSRPDGEAWTLETFTEGAKTTAVWSTVDISATEQTMRFDSTYYRPKYLDYADVVSNETSLEDITNIEHPAEIKRVYVDEGLQILLAQNIRTNRLDFSTTVYMPERVKKDIVRNKLRPNDVVMTRSGANFGDSAVYRGDPADIYACADCLIIRPQGIPGGYLSTYLNTKMGRALLTRGAYGMAQPHIAPSYLYTMKLPRLGKTFEQEIDSMVERAYALEKRSKSLYAEAETLLLDALGLDAALDAEAEAQRTYTQPASRAWSAGRLDAEYWEPQYTNLVDHFKSMPHTTLGELADFSNGATPRGADYLEEGIPFLRIQNVDKNRLDLEEVVYIDEETHNNLLQRSQLQPSDVLITITGRIGTAAVVPESLPVANINQHIVRMRWSGKGINPYYLSVFLNSKGGRLQTEREAYGTTRTALPYYCLERVVVPEAPQEIQSRIETKIRAGKAARDEAHRLLEDAKRRVEAMILNSAEE